MISNSDIKAGWVAKLKSNSNITAFVPASQIKEVEWKGTDFTYPAIRVQLHSLIPSVPDSNCRIFSSRVSILVFTENKSSKLADDIAGVIASELWGHSFTSAGVHFSGVILTGLDPAETPEDDTNSWKSSVNLNAIVQRA